MKQNTLTKILAIGAVTGIRSMAGVATLSLAAGGATRRIVPALALGEMILDKTPFVGDRVDALPLAGRALLGAMSGGLIAREQGEHVVLGGLLGATTAIVAAHLAYHARKRLPWSSVGGLVEDKHRPGTCRDLRVGLVGRCGAPAARFPLGVDTTRQ